MKIYHDSIMTEIQRYQHLPLLFSSLPSSLEEEVPTMESLEITAQQRSQNSTFIHHRRRLLEISELVERLGEHPDPTFQDLKQSFFIQLGIQVRFLGTLVDSQWETEKANRGFMRHNNSEAAFTEQAEIIDTCTRPSPRYAMLFDY